MHFLEHCRRLKTLAYASQTPVWNCWNCSSLISLLLL